MVAPEVNADYRHLTIGRNACGVETELLSVTDRIEREKAAAKTFAPHGEVVPDRIGIDEASKSKSITP